MGWGLGYNSKWHRDIGYLVPAYCDHPECNAEIDRGLAFLCGGSSMSDHGCGLYFCAKHLFASFGFDDDDCPQLCERCVMLDPPEDEDDEPNEYLDEDGNANEKWPGEFDAKPEHPSWMRHVVTDVSWEVWRRENPKDVAKFRAALKASA